MTFWQKSSEKCELLGLSAVLGEFSCGHCIVTCPIGKRNVFEQFWCKQKYFSSTYLCKIVTKVPYVLSHKFTLLDYSKESIHGIHGTKIISNFLTKQ